MYRLEGYSYYETGKYPEGLKAIETFFKEIKPEKIIASDYSYYGDLLVKKGNDSLAIKKYMKAYAMDTTNCDLLSKVAKSYSKLKDYDNVIKIYKKKTLNNCMTLNDSYEMGKAYFFMKQYGKADTTLRPVYEKRPDMITVIKYLAWANVSLDTTKLLAGKAKPYYEALIEQCVKTDSVKYIKDISEAYGYLMYFYFNQYNKTKVCDDAKKSLMYIEKMILIDPKDNRSLQIKGSLAGKCPN